MSNLENEGILSGNWRSSESKSITIAPKPLTEPHPHAMNTEGGHPYPLMSNPTDQQIHIPKTVRQGLSLPQEACLYAPYNEASVIGQGHIDQFAYPEFNQDSLVRMSIHRRELNLIFTRSDAIPSTPFLTAEITPLALFRNLRALRLFDFKAEMQPLLWRVVWLNVQLKGLMLVVSGEPFALEADLIKQGCRYAEQRKSIIEIAHGLEKAAALRRLPIMDLGLDNFRVVPFPFEWFGRGVLCRLSLCQCVGEGFEVPEDMEDFVEIDIHE